jgi:hypothetical protein
LITDLSKAYELLGVKPGVSSGELKAAHRDRANVCHPYRFVHDPRLQEKAQEKLKEINEAYELLSSGKTPRRAPPPPRAAETVYTAPFVPVVTVDRRSAPRGGSWKSTLVVLLFLAVFGVTTKVLLDRRTHAQPPREPEPVQVETSTRTEPATRVEAARKPTHTDSVPEQTAVVANDTSSSAPTPALATVTVLIDPESGLLAKPDCPVRSRMTYPSGSQPSAHCNINHAPPPKESKIKSIAEKILPQRRNGAKEESNPKD